MVKKIMVVEDDAEIRELIRLYLSQEGFQVVETSDGLLAPAKVLEENPDLVILDILLPGFDGIEICESIRKFSTVPIIFLSSKAEEVDKIIGLTIGADDYLAKPFSPRELVARIRTLLRRQAYANHPTQQSDARALIFSDLQINLLNYTVQLRQKPIELSSKEFGLLSYLARHPGQVFTTEQLYETIWGEPSIEETRTVLVHVSSLRKKIEENPSQPKYILTVRGVGYKFNDQVE